MLAEDARVIGNPKPLHPRQRYESTLKKCFILLTITKVSDLGSRVIKIKITNEIKNHCSKFRSSSFVNILIIYCLETIKLTTTTTKSSRREVTQAN